MQRIQEQIKHFFYTHHLGVILAVSALLRLNGLGSRDFWYDEAFTGIAVKEDWGRMMQILIADTHPPLYYFMVKGVGEIFSYTDVSIRSVSLFAGLAAIYFSYRFVKELFSERAAIFTSSILAVSPFMIYYSQEARSYIFFSTLFMAGMFTLVLALREKSRAKFIISGILFGLASLTHYAGLIYAGMAMFLIAYYSARTRNRNKTTYAPVQNVGIFFVTHTAIFLPWLPFFIDQFKTQQEKISWIEPATWHSFFSVIYMFFIGSPKGDLSMGMPQPNMLQGISWDIGMFFIVGLVFAASLHVVYKERKYWHSILFPSLGAVLLIFILSLAGIHYLVPRYLIGSAFLFSAILGVSLSHMRMPIAAGLLAIYVALLLLIIPQDPSEGYHILKKQQQFANEPKIVAVNAYDYVIAKYYFGYDRVILYNVDWPEYNPATWLGVNGSLQRAEEVRDIPAGSLFLFNTHTDIKTTWSRKVNELQLKKIEEISNLIIYKR